MYIAYVVRCRKDLACCCHDQIFGNYPTILFVCSYVGRDIKNYPHLAISVC